MKKADKIKFVLVNLLILALIAGCKSKTGGSQSVESLLPSNTPTINTASHNPPNIIWGNTVSGYLSDLSTAAFTVNPTYASNISITQPAKQKIKADTYFTFAGINLNLSRIEVWGSTDPNATLLTLNLLTINAGGPFNETVYLSAGVANYKIGIFGVVNGQSSLVYLTSFNVDNASSLDFSYYLPTSYVQAFNPAIMSAANQATAGLASDSDKARALHDYVVKNLKYDFDSLTNRKPQDALSVFTNKMGVCEGYANLYLAMLRAVGIKAKYISGDACNSECKSTGTWGSHAWNQVFWNGAWHNVDTTWDDPTINGHSDYPTGSNLRYTYYDISDASLSADHIATNTADKRSLEGVKILP